MTEQQKGAQAERLALSEYISRAIKRSKFRGQDGNTAAWRIVGLLTHRIVATSKVRATKNRRVTNKQ